MMTSPFLSAEDKTKIEAHKKQLEAIELAKEAVGERNEAFGEMDREKILKYVHKWLGDAEGVRFQNMGDQEFLAHVHGVRLQIQTLTPEERLESGEWLFEHVLSPMRDVMEKEVL